MEKTSIENKVTEMTEGYKNNTTQIAVFELGDNKTKYGINVNKIKSFINIKDIKTTDSLTNNPLLKGYCVIRKENFPIIDLYYWLNGKPLDFEKYNRLILTEFSGIIMAFPVTRILRIFSKTSEELEEPGNYTDRVSYITRIELFSNQNILKNKSKLKKIEKQIYHLKRRNKKRNLNILTKKIEDKQKELSAINDKIVNNKIKSNIELCFILDIEKLESELNSNNNTKIEEIIIKNKEKIKLEKPVLIAEDSVVIQKLIKKVFEGLNIPFELYKNGKEVVDRMKKNQNFSLLITDIEMPILDGFSVIKWTKENYPNKAIIVNSSMSNEGVKQKCESLGVDYFVEKNQLDKLIEIISSINNKIKG